MSVARRYLRHRTPRRWVFRVSLLAVLALAGCAGSGGLLEAELPDDGPVPTTSAAAAGRLLQRIVVAGEGAADTGRFTLTITDEEATSLLSLGSVILREVDDLPLEDFQQIQDLAQGQDIPELEGIDLEGIDLEGIDLGQLQELLTQRERLPFLGGDRLGLRLTIEDPGVYFLANGQMIVRGNARFLVVQLPFRVVGAPHASQGEMMLNFVEGQLGPLAMPEFVFDYLGHGAARGLLAGREYAEISEIRVNDGVLTVSGRWQR